MKRVLVFSDTHGNVGAIKKITPLFDEYDYIVHLGDYAFDVKEYKSILEEKFISVKGNCDFGGEPVFFKVENVYIMAVHGNKYNVKSTLTPLYLKAREENCNLVLYGHTHVDSVIKENDTTMVNPGTMARFSKQTYASITIDGDDIQTEIHVIKG